MSCPLCNSEHARPSWLGSTFYRGREFPYAQCASCGSLHCDPMPDEETLGQMYGPDYEASFAAEPSIADPKEPLRVVEWLKKTGAGTFVDYGCGQGSLLVEAARLNWKAVGVEFDEEVAKKVEEHTGLRVVNRSSDLLKRPLADVLHLGDVIEHLTEIDRQMPEILRMIKPGSLLIAQGPLEGNANLFTLAVRLARVLRPPRRTEMAPYHVLLATAEGQRTLFRRFGLEELAYSVHEVAWPAPSELTRADLRRPRSVALFMLRRISQVASTLRPGRWGNRYFYVGRHHG